MHFALGSAIFVTSVSLATASLQVNNWCYQDVYIYQSNNGGCDSGPNGICFKEPGAAPFYIPAGNGGSSNLNLNWIDNGYGTSVKISKDVNFGSGILQYEYTFGFNGLYWDLSNLDGSGVGLVGTPFANDNVKISPTGDGSGSGTCLKIHCPAGQVCIDAYQKSDDNDTRFCPADTGDMYIDLCEPNPQFSNKQKRTQRFSA